MLAIKIISLNVKVREQDWFSRNDLFVRIKYGSQENRTTVRWNDNNPIWNQAFLFNHSENTKLILELYDQNVWSPEKKLYSHSFVPKMNEMAIIKEDIFNIEIGDIHCNEKCKLERMGKILNCTMENKACLETKLKKIKEIIE